MDHPNWAALHEMLGDLRATLDNLGEIQKRAEAVRGVAWSEDELIKAVVGPGGELVELEIDPRVYHEPNAGELAALIVATVRDAIEVAARKGEKILAESLPSDLRVNPMVEMDVGVLLGRHDADLADLVRGEARDA